MTQNKAHRTPRRTKLPFVSVKSRLLAGGAELCPWGFCADAALPSKVWLAAPDNVCGFYALLWLNHLSGFAFTGGSNESQN
jgi:hypothetical protein